MTPIDPPAPVWLSDRELSAREIEAIDQVAPIMLSVLDERGVDVLTHRGVLVLQSTCLGIAEKLGFDEAQARGLSIATEVAALDRKFS